ncbi:LysR family transcriptional regulator, partial [Desulfocarbo indianensis]
MHGKDHLDTYLLRVLYTLLTEQSVTRTAVKLGQSQPAISNTLKRLREITGDAILVRGKNGMVPTERGHELLTLAQQSLEAMERIARPSQEFDPANTTRTFHLGAPDYLDAFFLPNIVERLRKQAPQAKLVVHPLNAGVDYLAALEQGGMDLVIGNW